MRTSMLLAIVALNSLLAACQTYKPEAPPYSAADVVHGVTLTTDSFRGTSELSTPKYRTDWLQWFYLRRLEVKGEPIVHQLCVVNLAPEWYYLESAIDSESTHLPAVVIDRSVQTGVDGSPNARNQVITKETVGVRLEASYLSTHAKSGIVLRLYGRGGIYREVSVPSYFVQGYLEALAVHGVAVDAAPQEVDASAG